MVGLKDAIVGMLLQEKKKKLKLAQIKRKQMNLKKNIKKNEIKNKLKPFYDRIKLGESLRSVAEDYKYSHVTLHKHINEYFNNG